MTEAPPMVCYSRGVLDSVVDKLTDVKEKHPMVLHLLEDLVSFREDLVNKLAGGRATHLHVRVWMKQNRQLFYDIQDMIDLKLGINTKAVDESSDEDFEEQIDEFRTSIKEARSRSERYHLPDKLVPATSDAHRQDATGGPNRVPVDSHLIWEKKGVLVGIDGPRKKLESHLRDAQNKKRKVVCVLGMGGVGKTTLATRVYEDLTGEQFDCHASVTVGRNSPVAALLDVFLQVNPEMVGNALNEQEVIPQLWEFLQNKSYFLFIDDIRSKQAWSVINCALPNNNLGSRILATTRVKDVAISCSVRPADFIYHMKGLDENDSISLLSTIPAQTEVNFVEKCHDMLQMCCGLPLAIIVTSGLLALKSADLGSLGKLEESDVMMRNVLNICFADLPPPMKACFLYLSTFPENYNIMKGRLIWRWVAEGFIPKIGQASMWETGESYFNELINRKLIRPVFEYGDDDLVVACTVHSVIHDFIASLSRQEDFHTTAVELISGPFPYATIRRFTVDYRRKENNEADIFKSSAIRLSRVRSLTVFGVAGSVPDLDNFKHLRVLDLEDTKSLDDQQVERIQFPFLLKYLALGGTNITKLPQQIMALKHLATLDLRRTRVRKLPSSGNKKLLSLFATSLILPRQMAEEGMEELEELSEVLLGDDALLNLDGSHADDVVGLINKSRRLRMLGIKFAYITETEQGGVKNFLEEIEKSDLQSLSLDDYPCDSVSLLVQCWASKQPHNLQKFELRICDCFPQVPAEMALIKALTHLHIHVKVAEVQGIRTLGSLANLILLKLFSEDGNQERLSISSEDGFQSLKVFWFRSSYFRGMQLQFLEGAMPHLHRLQIEFNARKTKFFYHNYDFGIQNLRNLLHVRAIIRCKDATDSEVKASEAAIRHNTTSIMDIRVSILPESSSHLPLPEHISFVMEDSMVSSSTGAMNSVLTKLATLMGERYTERTGTDKQELMLKDELLNMNGLLKQMSNRTDLNEEMKECRNQMRELTYDIDDCIEDLMVPSLNEEGSGSTERRVMPHDFTDQIQKLNTRVKKVGIPSMVRKAEMRTYGPPRHMPREQWLLKVSDEAAKPTEADQPLSVESMRKIYDDLSSDTKTCLLYLSIFPANKVLRKDRLIRRWAAEGFLPKRSMETWWETGEDCFFELIARKLIEPIYWEGEKEDAVELFLPTEKDLDVFPTGCKIRDSVHDFITSLSSEENFVKPGQDGVFWRLHDSVFDDIPGALACSKVRSLTVTPDYPRIKWIDYFFAFKHVRVLDLEYINGAPRPGQLPSFGGLSLLRYLGLHCSALEYLPQELLGLEHLEHVELYNSWLERLPAFKSRKLVSLIANGARLPPREKGELVSRVLEELSTVVVHHDGDRLAKIVTESKRLRTLRVRIQGSKGLRDLVGAIGNSNIQSLSLDDDITNPSVLLNSLQSCWAQQRPRHLQKFELTIRLKQFPRNMPPSLIWLTDLSITLSERIDAEGLSFLGSLPNLLFLRLGNGGGYLKQHTSGYLKQHTTERNIISENGFRCLRVFSYTTGTMDLQFEGGAMPQLRMLRLEFTAMETVSKHDFGIQFLTCLVRVDALIECWNSEAASVEAVEATMRNQVSRNPNNPMLKIRKIGEKTMVPEMGE